MSNVTLTDVSYFRPDGTPIISPVSLSLRGRIGLVGHNGAGKTTLLRLMAGEINPASGSIYRTSPFSYVPQRIEVHTSATMADILGISGILSAIRSIQDGSTNPDDFAIVGLNWDIEEQSLQSLQKMGILTSLTPADRWLDRTLAELSGGEVTAALLAGAFLRRPPVLLLDEPSNDLDAPGRKWLYEQVNRFQGCMVVASHDPQLLHRMNAIVRIHNTRLTYYTCSYSRYLELVEAEKSAARHRAAVAKAVLKTERRNFEAEQKRAAHSRQQGRTSSVKSKFPSAAINLRRSRAEEQAGKQRAARQDRVDRAIKAAQDASMAAQEDDHILIDLPETVVPPGKAVLEVTSAGRTLRIQGPERVHLSGPNGSGKTTLLRTLMGEASLPDFSVDYIIAERGYLPQRLDHLDDSQPAIVNLQRSVPSLSRNQAHAVLARFLLRDKRADQDTATLSGGERLRLALACLLAMQPAPRLILLDEPTNNLDGRSVTELVEAVNQYRGAMIVVSHDHSFLQQISINRRWTMAALQCTGDEYLP